jgi:polysaccharide biosynthesis/export protein
VKNSDRIITFALMNKLRFVFASVLLLSMSGCYINADMMLKTPKDFVFDDPSQETIPDEYIIAPNDIIQFRLFSNKAYRITDMSAGAMEGNNRMMFNRQNQLNYQVNPTGFVRLPILDSVYLSGMTVRNAELFLETLYDSVYVDPFVQIEIINKRVIVFPGGGSEARIIYLQNNNTTLLEAIGMAGGVSGRGRANRIKIMRQKGDGTRKVFLIDLSTIEGLKSADMIVQANDYIYVEPVPYITREILQEVTPVISLITSAVLVVTSIRLLTR